MTVEYSGLPAHEKYIFDQTLKTGNLNIFTNYYFRLPNSGTRWTPDDRLGNYRELFRYDVLFGLWKENGKPDSFIVPVDGYDYPINTLWQNEYSDPVFLYPHGYMLLDWSTPIISPATQIALAITGAGTGKTSIVAVAALTYCALYPAFRFQNGAPSTQQANQMIAEMQKWATGTPYEKFIKPSRSKELFLKSPYPKIVIGSPFNPKYESHFLCQTVGQDASSFLGAPQDWINLDEVQLMVGLLGMLPKFATRSRAQRDDGSQYWGKLSMLTNPGPNPELMLVWKRMKKLQRDPDCKVKIYLVRGIDSSINPYTSGKQMAYQNALMDETDRQRWHGGLETVETTNQIISESLISANVDPDLDTRIANGEIPCEKRDGMDMIYFETPPELGNTYLVTGDPGQGNALRMTQNNVPIVTVWDVSNFAKEPINLVYFRMIDGGGKYTPWLDTFRLCMVKYSAVGYYDATNLNSAFEDSGAFEINGALGPGIGLNYQYTTTPVSFGGNNKKWARSIFILLAQANMLRWPTIPALSFQASIYRETGEGVRDLADDILASIFVLPMALRMDGALWFQFTDRFHWDKEDPFALDVPGRPGQILPQRKAGRYSRGYRRR